MKLNLSQVVAAACLAFLPVIASAELSANISLASNYKTRGQDQDLRKGQLRPALQGGFDYSHSSGCKSPASQSILPFCVASSMSLRLSRVT